MLTDKEHDEAANALINWFKSQNINPGDASVIMLKLIATQLVAKTTEVDRLVQAISLATKILTTDVASQIKKRMMM